MIQIYDNVFDYEYCAHAWRMATNSFFSLGWQDTDRLGGSEYVNLHSVYSEKDVKQLMLLEKLEASPLQGHIEGKELKTCVVNLTVPGQTFFPHIHPNADVVLFYVGLEWKREWAGETLFYSKDNKQLEMSIEYVPNRVVYHEGDYPHAVRPATFHAPFFRFTIVAIFNSNRESVPYQTAQWVIDD